MQKELTGSDWVICKKNELLTFTHGDHSDQDVMKSDSGLEAEDAIQSSSVLN